MGRHDARCAMRSRGAQVTDIAIIVAVVAAWTITLRFIWRARILERLMGTP